MAISEETKILVAQQKAVLKSKYQANLRGIEGYGIAITRLKAANVQLKKEYDALDADIPAPTPIPVIPEV